LVIRICMYRLCFQADYFDVMDFTLSSIDMAKIDAMTATGYRIVDATLVAWAPQWD